jgi:single-strand DNA-binding protein
MSRGVNRVFLLGRLGAAPISHTATNGAVVVSVSLATNEQWRDAQGAVQTRTQWHRVVFFQRLAEVAAAHLAKGSRLHVEGKLNHRQYVDKAGVTRSITEVVATQLELLGEPRHEADEDALPAEDLSASEDDLPPSYDLL